MQTLLQSAHAQVLIFKIMISISKTFLREARSCVLKKYFYVLIPLVLLQIMPSKQSMVLQLYVAFHVNKNLK